MFESERIPPPTFGPSGNGRIARAGEVPAQPLVRQHRGCLQVPRRSGEGGSSHVAKEDAGGEDSNTLGSNHPKSLFASKIGMVFSGRHWISSGFFMDLNGMLPDWTSQAWLVQKSTHIPWLVDHWTEAWPLGVDSAIPMGSWWNVIGIGSLIGAISMIAKEFPWQTPQTYWSTAKVMQKPKTSIPTWP